MKKNKAILLTTLAVLVILGGCKREQEILKDPSDHTTVPGIALTEIESWTEVVTDAMGETQIVVQSTARNVTTMVTKENGETAYVPVMVPDTHVDEVKISSPAGGGNTPGRTTKAATTKKPISSAATTTMALLPMGGGQSGQSTTTTTTTTTTAIAATTATATTTTTTTTATTKPSSPAVTTPQKPGVTTTVPVLQGESVKTRITYLNSSAKKVSELSAAELSAYGVPQDKRQAILDSPEGWKIYSVKLDFENKEASPVTLSRVLVSYSDKQDVYFNGSLQTQVGLNPDGKKTETFYVLAKSSDADAFVLKKIGDLSMRVEYSATADNVTPSYVYAAVGK